MTSDDSMYPELQPCPRCPKFNPPTANFCSECGVELRAYCDVCNSLVTLGEGQCSKCLSIPTSVSPATFAADALVQQDADRGIPVNCEVESRKSKLSLLFLCLFFALTCAVAWKISQSDNNGTDVGVNGTDVDVNGTDVEVDGTDVEVDGTDEEVDGTDEEVDGTDEDVDGTDEDVNGTDVDVEYSGELGLFDAVNATGKRIVYVIACSASMSGYDGIPMRVAQQELLASIADINANHQFQIIFYNEYPKVFNLFKTSRPTLLYGHRGNLKYAVDFIEGIQPSGQKNYMLALNIALDMKPDVIFFLTDADEPRLTSYERALITKRNEEVGASINCIQLGVGKSPDPDYAFLCYVLATLNGGQFRYVDLTKLSLGDVTQNDGSDSKTVEVSDEKPNSVVVSKAAGERLVLDGVSEGQSLVVDDKPYTLEQMQKKAVGLRVSSPVLKSDYGRLLGISSDYIVERIDARVIGATKVFEIHYVIKPRSSSVSEWLPREWAVFLTQARSAYENGTITSASLKGKDREYLLKEASRYRGWTHKAVFFDSRRQRRGGCYYVLSDEIGR